MNGWLTLFAFSCASDPTPPRASDDSTPTGVEDSVPTDSGEPPPPTDDADGDGTPDSGDCSPSNPAIGPNVPEIVGDGVDQNCDGLDREVTDIRPYADQIWGEEGLYGFGVDMAIANVGDTQVALIGQWVADGAGRIFVIGHPEDPMRRVMLQDGAHPFDDHLGDRMIGAEVDGHPVVVAPYHLVNDDSFLAGWALDGPPGDLGEADLMFNVLLTTALRTSAGRPPFYGPDLTDDGTADLFWIETASTSHVLQVWPGPVTTTRLTEAPEIVGYPAGTADVHNVEVTRSNGPTSDLALFIPVGVYTRYIQFVESGADGGRIDMESPTDRPNPHAVRADMDGDGILERCVSDGFWVADADEMGMVACFAPATGGTLTPAEADTLLLGELLYSSLGYALAAGDLDGDGRDELIVGAPTILTNGRAGLIYILKLVDGALTVHAILSDFNVDARFGIRLGVGDLDQDGHLDIVAPSSGACFGGATSADPDASCPGAVWVIPGAAGLW